MSAARTAAARVLVAVLRRQATLADEIERARPDIGDARDRALLLEMVAGTLRWQNALDAVIARASGRGIDAIDLPVLAVLRLGAYQLRHLTRIPPHAIVHESVETVRAIGAPNAAGFVNAVMRTLIRRGQQLKLPARPDANASRRAQVSYLTTTLSHPEWLVERWLARYGFEDAERWCAFNNTTPELMARSAGRVPRDAMVARLAAAGIDATTSPLVPDAIGLPPGAASRLTPDLRAELVFQDEASQLVGRAVGVTPGDRVLDLCAAPGGKTLLMASDLAAGGAHASPPIIASDRRPRRVALLSQTTAGAVHPVLVVALDAAEALPFGASFDVVLVDAPCSGLGTLRREPDLKWSRQESDLAGLSAAQGRMLRRAADAVGPGGRLVYATCSSEPDENRNVVDAFLAEDPRFALRGLGPAFPAGLLDRDGCLQTEPGRHQLDAFFAAVLVRQRTT